MRAGNVSKGCLDHVITKEKNQLDEKLNLFENSVILNVFNHIEKAMTRLSRLRKTESASCG